MMRMLITRVWPLTRPTSEYLWQIAARGCNPLCTETYARLRPYLDHGILELANNTAERAMRSVAIGCKNYLFVGSQTGGKSAAIAYTLIETAKLNGIDPQAWLADTLARIPDYKINRVDDVMPWKSAP